MPNRYQRGGVYKRGKTTKVWYGTYRFDDPDGKRRSLNLRLGNLTELPNRADAHRRLDEVVREVLASRVPAGSSNSGAVKAETKFSELVERWKKSEGPNWDDTTFEHYRDALRAYVQPTWNQRTLDSINRESVQSFLAEQAKRYSQSSLKDMRLVLKMVLGWAEKNGDLKRPHGWLDGIRVAKRSGGRKVTRTVLEPEQTRAFISGLKEPYSTLVLFLALLGRRIEEAVGLQPDDLNAFNVLRIVRVVYKGRVKELEPEFQQTIPLGEAHAELINRMHALGAGQKWVFHGKNGNPLNPGNARRRHLHRLAKELGVVVGGWHDFRHTLVTTMRRSGVHPKVIAGVVGHKRVELAPNVYDHCNQEEIRSALGVVGNQLLPNVLPSGSRNG